MPRLTTAIDKLKRRRHPLCFLHVPKSAGSSVTESVEAALPPEAVAHQRTDTFIFPNFSGFDQFDESTRSRLVLSESEFARLAKHQVVSGHFPLPRLLGLAPHSNIATALREPRARMLSGVLFTLLMPPGRFMFGAYENEVLKLRERPLEASFTDSSVARITDNIACRLVLDGDPRVRDDEFIAPAEVEGVVESALEQLDRLAYVGILEWDDIWADLSEFFGVPLNRMNSNVSGEDGIPEGALPMPSFDMEKVLDLMDQRSAADRILYETLLERKCGEGRARRVADAAFASQLVRFGDLSGASATKLSRMA